MDPVDDPRPPDVLVQLRRTQHAVRSRLNVELAPTGLTTPQYTVLAELESRGGSSASELARAIGVTAQTMNVLVGGLEAYGLVARTEHPAHGRILVVKLTRQGRAALKRGRGLARAVEDRLLAGVAPADRDRLLDILKSIEARSLALEDSRPVAAEAAPV
jgi:DNA-binding MarR family transcriptional regulator